MMKVSSRVHYGLRAMTELARAHGSGPIPLSEIARIESLPLAYLEQLVSDLRRAGLVEGTRGLHGGYRLSRPPGAVSVGEIVHALEGPIELVECLGEEYRSGAFGREPACMSRGIWARVQRAIDQVLDQTTLQDLCSGQQFEDNRETWTLLPVISAPVERKAQS